MWTLPVMMMVPEAGKQTMSDDNFTFCACIMEPWDGLPLFL
jgi:glutamate synthase domain-containing protein 1